METLLNPNMLRESAEAVADAEDPRNWDSASDDGSEDEKNEGGRRQAAGTTDFKNPVREAELF
eukprot:SAG22_NODE_6484_length_848_cov_1.506008_2_plen_63_part_00